MKPMTIIALLWAALAAGSVQGKNIDLATLPGRQSVQLTIYNSEDLTLVKETRYVALKTGMNKLQFSWANTLIDPTSLDFRPLEHASEIDLVDSVISGQKPQSLIWNVRSSYEGQVKVEISYFTSGLTWQMDYVAICNPEETQMRFQGYVRVFNKSGEEYAGAEVRLIVGTINLVEKIADIARRYRTAVPKPNSALHARYRRKAARSSFRMAEECARPSSRPGRPSAPKKVVKEGLSEYFMFSVQGQETIRNGWSKRMRAVDAEKVTFDIVYRLRSFQYGPRPVRFFLWRNDEEHRLGDSPLPNGRVRVFRNNGKDGLSYLGDKLLRYVPIKAEIEVNLGPDDLVVYEAVKMGTRRYNFHFHRNHVCGWDERQLWTGTIRNYRLKPIRFDLRLRYGGDVEFESEVKTTSFDYRTVETKMSVTARNRERYPYELEIHLGSNAKQQRVKISK
jgi:hypothetical protein